MPTCKPTLYLLKVKEIFHVHFIITITATIYVADVDEMLRKAQAGGS
jgi:hypothetical protein